MKDNTSWLLIVIVISIVVFLGFFGMGNFRSFGGCNMMGIVGGGYGYGMMFFGWITWILVVILMIAGIYWLIKTASRK